MHESYFLFAVFERGNQRPRCVASPYRTLQLVQILCDQVGKRECSYIWGSQITFVRCFVSIGLSYRLCAYLLYGLKSSLLSSLLFSIIRQKGQRFYRKSAQKSHVFIQSFATNVHDDKRTCCALFLQYINMDICTYAIKSELSKNCVAHPLSEILRTYHIFTYHYTKSLADFFMYKQVQLPALLCNYDRPNGRLFIQGVPCSLPHPLG